MFKVETKKPQIITTSLFDPAQTIDLNTFDQPHQRIMLNTGSLVQTIEPLQQTQTQMNIEVNEKLLTAPLTQVMKLVTVNVYQNNQLINTIDIEDDVNIEEANVFERFLFWIKSIFGIFSADAGAVKTYPLQQ